MGNNRLVTNTDIPERREFELLPLATNSPKEFSVDGRRIKYGKGGITRIHDIGLAREIEARHGRDGDNTVMVVPVERQPPKGTRRTFLVRLPENYERGEK